MQDPWHRLESVIAFAEDCRWLVPSLDAKADELNSQAIALFGEVFRRLDGN